MSSQMSRPVSREGSEAGPKKRFPVAAWIGSAFPLSMVWLALYVTHAVPMEALAAIAVAIVVLVAWVGMTGTVRARCGR
ncbi:hypothetical protein ACFH04_02160 [Streptomyces noboritoensis]|uniref:Uncharacterized protein n=1 Tax=Streptomyces noboritoensis TaxID=67337 RepID=A0ABV6T9R7_9ACTN